MRKFFCLSLLLLLYASAFSQDVISGKVTGTDKTPLQGVTVAVAGTKTQVITNADGTYSISVPGGANELTFTYVNSRAVTEKINGRKQIDVQMLTESVQLGEVVVVGYGTQKKANLTGAVDQVTSEVLENRSIPNLTQGLQGVLPNLNIRMLDGKPNQSPRFNIRGATSIGQGGNALVLIDGVEGDPSVINPNDIATVSILKDALTEDVLKYTNQFRKSKGLPALEMKKELNTIARSHSEDMASGRRSFGHGGYEQRESKVKKMIQPYKGMAENVAGCTNADIFIIAEHVFPVAA